MTGYDIVLATCMPKPTRIVISCDPEFYWGRAVWHGKCGVLHFGNIQRITCCAISAPAKLSSFVVFRHRAVRMSW